MVIECISTLTIFLEHRKIKRCQVVLIVVNELQIQKLRDEQLFVFFYGSVLKKSQCFDFIEQPVHPGKRRALSHSMLQFVDGHSGAQETFNPEACCDRYRFMYYEALDSVFSSIKSS